MPMRFTPHFRAVKITRLSCHRFRSNEVGPWLSLIAHNRGDLWRQLVLPKRIENWSLTTLPQRPDGRKLKTEIPVDSPQRSE